MSVQPFRMSPEGFQVLDQRRLPARQAWLTPANVADMAEAIRTLTVRGAPAIGIAAAWGLTLSAGIPSGDAQALRADAEILRATRPTAVNLAWALDRMLKKAWSVAPGQWRAVLTEEARAIWDEDVDMNRRIGGHGAGLLPGAKRLMTHCNAGALATGGIGTALGIVRAVHARSPLAEVVACETRPLGQGARLTAWELSEDGIPVTVICDTMAGARMARGGLDAVIVGADRVAKNGDTANKIGTYNLAVLARHHGIPFFVACPSSTLDPATQDGAGIPVEERGEDEIRLVGERLWAPPAAAVWNPAFDVTPASLITAIVTEAGVHHPPFDFGSGS